MFTHNYLLHNNLLKHFLGLKFFKVEQNMSFEKKVFEVQVHSLPQTLTYIPRYRTGTER